MELIWYIAILCVVKSCYADFFSDLDKLDIDAQLHEIDIMLEKLDDESDDLVDDDSDTFDGFTGGPCKFKCKKGGKPVPRKNHVPTSNGCGSFGIQLDTSGLPQMTSCCDAHDICYDTCNKDRDQCDKDFKTCLDDMCEKLKSGITGNQYEGCKETSKLIYGGTTALGCSPYLSAQQNACECKVEETGSKSSKQTPQKEQTQESIKKVKSQVNKSNTKIHEKSTDTIEKDRLIDEL